MRNIQYDMIYLAACGVNGSSPEAEFIKELDLEKMYQLSYMHSMEALIGMVLRQAGVSLSKEWNEKIAKAVRKILLFDAERTKLLSFMEERGIWYLPLKGIILKDYYPAIGMRQMSDNDILFDYSFSDEIQKYMESQGYKTVSIGKHHHDEYEKEPVYNFEMHGNLYGEKHIRGWSEYYADIKKKLILNEGSSYGYHFTEEDFYVYIVSHIYKHYEEYGTGIRGLLDMYVYLKEMSSKLDYAYIEQECTVLGITDFEKQNRELCKKVFGVKTLAQTEALENELSAEEKELIRYYFTSGAYGTLERGVKKRIEKVWNENEDISRLSYMWSRIFPPKEQMKKHYSQVYKHKLLLPYAYICRLWEGLHDKKRREKMFVEVDTIKKMK